MATIIGANGRRIPGGERACNAGEPLPHKPAVSKAERNSWRGAARVIVREKEGEKEGMDDLLLGGEAEGGCDATGAGTATAAAA